MQKNLAEARFPERAITYNKARKLLLRNMKEEVDMPTCFIGPPGVGKTALVEQVAEELQAHLCVIPLSCYDASELKGIPRVVSLEDIRKMDAEHLKVRGSGLVTYYAHNFEFPATDDPDMWIFFFDEFNTVPPSTQVPIFQATQKRCITGSYRFPKRNRIVLAGNRPKDSEAVQPIPSPIISRVNLHEIKFDHREWLEWGHHIHNGIRSFISANPDKLCYFTDQMVKDVQPYATPRTWDYANTILKAYNEEELATMDNKTELWSDLFSHLAGTVGYETLSFLDSHQKGLLHYIQAAAEEKIGSDNSPMGKLRRMLQKYEETPHCADAKPTVLMILKQLPEIPPAKAATFLKRLQVVGPLATQVLKEQPAIAKAIAAIPNMRENVAQLK